MSKFRAVAVATLVAATFQIPAPPLAQEADADMRARARVESMLAAHGGTAAWERADVVGFEHVLYMASMPEANPHWMISQEVHDRRQGRRHARYPLWGATISGDGKQVWSVNWKFPNPAQQMLGVHYQFAFLPWLSLSTGAMLTMGEPGALPESEVVHDTVQMTLPGGGPTWTFYIDRETDVMAGFALSFGERQGAIHRVRRYAEVDGLKLPSSWVTYAGPEQRIIGYHALLDVTLDAEFDSAWMEVPDGADVLSEN